MCPATTAERERLEPTTSVAVAGEPSRLGLEFVKVGLDAIRAKRCLHFRCE